VKLFRHPLLLLGCRLALAGMFLYASHDKLLAPAAFAKIVYQWQVGGAVFSNLVAVILPWVELIAGLLLLFGAWTREAALVVAGPCWPGASTSRTAAVRPSRSRPAPRRARSAAWAGSC
jgi:uncharacterized membrane protein YphA (DoxX/SURF4 family)